MAGGRPTRWLPLRRTRALAVGACAAALAASTLAPVSAATAPDGSEPVDDPRPNVVVIMADDLSAELVQYMDNVQQMAAEGTSFDNYFVSTSRCCPSRATFLSGGYPHNTGVVTNNYKGPRDARGGFGAYRQELGEDIGPVLQQTNYRTGLLGKYLNQYRPSGSRKEEPAYPADFVPAGWHEWFGIGNGYDNFHYTAVTETETAGQVVQGRRPPGSIGTHQDFKYHESEYLTDVLTTQAMDFVLHAQDPAAAPRDDVVDPFALVITPFGTHQGSGVDPQDDAGYQWDNDPEKIKFPPAPRDRAQFCPAGSAPECHPPKDWVDAEFPDGDCGALPDGGCPAVPFPDPMWAATYDSDGNHHVNPPDWLPDRELSPAALADARRWHLERIQMAQSVDDLVGTVRGQLEQLGILDKTYLIFTSDNGYALGQHRLLTGKGTPYDHDVRVPLIIRPPGGTAPVTSPALAQNTDIAATLAEIAGTAAPPLSDGRSLLPLVLQPDGGSEAPPVPEDWRQAALLTYRTEQKHGFGRDPDWTQSFAKIPDIYAIRTLDYLYVDNDPADDGPPADHLTGEFYRLSDDPQQMTNRYDELTEPERVALYDAVEALFGCAGAACLAVVPPSPAILGAPAG